jgi:hypothetical protein
MNKRLFGGFLGLATAAGALLFCMALLGFLGCEGSDPLPSEDNKILVFKIDKTAGLIDEEKGTITVTLPDPDLDLSAVVPEITLSEGATVDPNPDPDPEDPETVVDLRDPSVFTVIAANGAIRQYSVTAAKKVVLESIRIQALPTKTVYKTGESFSPEGLIVVGLYSDGKTKEETEYALSPAPVPTNAVGPQTVTVTVGEKTASFTITVSSAALESIAVAVQKTNYSYGEAFDPAGIAVTGTYDDGSTKAETIMAENVTGYNPAIAGEQTLLARVNDKTAAFKVNVVVVELQSIAVAVLKPSYSYGEAFDPAGIVVTGTYSDNSTKTEIITVENVTGYDPEKPGSQKLLVTVNGKTAAFDVTVAVKREVAVTIGWPNTRDEPAIFGIPEGGIVLSASGDAYPDKILVSAAAAGNNVYSAIQWYVDGSNYSTGNIITINAAAYTLKIPHYLTFTGTKDGVEYSRTITFTVNP